jgi:nucleoside-diphosphate-sugar epimerase
MVYGPGDRQHRLFNYLKRIDDNRPAIIVDEKIVGWRWTKGYVENVAEAIVMAVTNNTAVGKIYNVGEEETLSESEWVKEIGKAAGWNGKVITVSRNKLPKHLVQDINTEQDLITDSTRIRDELGYKEIVSFRDGLIRTIEWERENPPENIDPEAFDYDAEDKILENEI